jgi:hypothetical protein
MVMRPARGRNHSRTKRPDSGGRYGLLLLTLIVAYLLSAFDVRAAALDLQVVLFAAVLLLALRTSPLPGRWPVLIGAVTLAGSGVGVWASATGTQTGLGAADLWKSFVLLMTVILIVRHVLAKPAVTIQSIYGALSAYLITGLMFAACYAAIGHLGHSGFFVDHEPGTTQTFQYFSFTTLTTLGYGDFTAGGNVGRAIAVLEALSGQVFLATLVARLVAAYGVSSRRRAPVPAPRPPRIIQAGTRTTRRGRPPARVGQPSRSAVIRAAGRRRWSR